MRWERQRFCRYCKTYDDVANLIYYAHCSYGHPYCLLENKGIAWLKTLPTWQYNKIKWDWLEALGFVDELKVFMRTLGLTIVRKRNSRVVHVRGLPKRIYEKAKA
jgi:hypothetical protein